VKAHEIMTTNVLSAKPGMKVHEIATLMVQHRISALPVLTDDGALVGIVTESDLLHRRETGTERKRSWWLDMFTDADSRAREFVKAHAAAVEDIMSRVVVTVPYDSSVAEVADILDSHRIRRVPVIRDGKVVGIISRSDLVRALAMSKIVGSTDRIDNGALHKAVFEAIHKQSWINTIYVSFSVSDGTVQLVGFVDSNDQKRALKVLVSEIPGVKSVDDQVRLRNWQTTI